MATEYKVLFRMIYCCGLRNNEACSLKTENVYCLLELLPLSIQKETKTV